MRKNLLKRLAAFMLVACSCTSIMAQIPDGYYDSLKGKSGAELKNAVHDIIKSANVLVYGSGNGKTWWGFWLTDRTSDGRFIDRYSPESAWPQSTSQGRAGTGMNIEHSFAKSWGKWTEQDQGYRDLYNLMPCESKINQKKSNYPMGKVVNASIGDNGATKVGPGSDGSNYWEPSDEWKGDFARGYMYMATCYQDNSWYGNGTQILQNGAYPTLKQWAYELYIQWAKADQPTQVEITRNNAVYKIQGNRNPFVDFPNLMDYIWGDSIGTDFDPAATVCTANYAGGDTPTDPSTDESIAEYVFTGGDCGFTTETTTGPEGKSIWKTKDQYGWVGSSYFGSKQDGDARIVSPEIDLAGYSKASMSFEHAANKMDGAAPQDMFSVEIRHDGATDVIDVIGSDLISWPKGTVWTFNNSGDISLNEYAGKKIQIVFHYTGTTEYAGTWEIKNLYVKGTKTATSVSAAPHDDSLGFAFFTLDGQRLDNIAGYRGVVIVKQGDKTWKIAR